MKGNTGKDQMAINRHRIHLGWKLGSSSIVPRAAASKALQMKAAGGGQGRGAGRRALALPQGLPRSAPRAASGSGLRSPRRLLPAPAVPFHLLPVFPKDAELHQAGAGRPEEVVSAAGAGSSRRHGAAAGGG